MYEAVGEKIFGTRSNSFSPGDAPDGLIMHSAGPSDDGWYVYDVWESQQHFDRFVQDRLMPALQDMGAPMGQPAQVYKIYNLILPEATPADR